MENPDPVIHKTGPRLPNPTSNAVLDPPSIDNIFDCIRDICDPEYPNSLEELAVVLRDQIIVDASKYYVRIDYTPTIPHCSMATLIGLCIRVKLLRCLPPSYDVDVFIKEGTHVAEFAINKQLNDKERVAAAMENPHLISVVDECLSGVRRPGIALSDK